MNKKHHRKLHGPGWGEVILGALLSLLLGAVLAFAFLVFKPVEKVKEMPKEPLPKVVYYLEGNAASARARQAQVKSKAFMQGQSVVLNEDELNTIVGGFTAPPAKPAELSLPAAKADKTVNVGAPNFRIKESVLQLGVPVKLSAYDFEHEVILQARGGFAKQGDTFVFEPTQLYLGSCPVERIPGVNAWLLKRLVATATYPAELPAAWQKLSDVSVDGANLKLTTVAVQ